MAGLTMNEALCFDDTAPLVAADAGRARPGLRPPPEREIVRALLYYGYPPCVLLVTVVFVWPFLANGSAGYANSLWNYGDVDSCGGRQWEDDRALLADVAYITVCLLFLIMEELRRDVRLYRSIKRVRARAAPTAGARSVAGSATACALPGRRRRASTAGGRAAPRAGAARDRDLKLLNKMRPFVILGFCWSLFSVLSIYSETEKSAAWWVLYTHNASVKLWIKHYPAMAKVLPSPHRKRDPVDRVCSAATSMLASVDSSLADVLKDTDLASSAIPDTIEEDTKGWSNGALPELAYESDPTRP
ncbi:hypothetical protein SO694_00153057 [Aureococcus anophagefferens]|uniref:G-protein coupled receptors family 1 profile domain-containing protein n=1 Tax=Aureococcus anophagefferens TaxID=44056 RepID=A0ABR1G024_AURAN